jgi:SAM-dependent methyltransferase
LITLYLEQQTDIFRRVRIRLLHVAPEPALRRLFEHAEGLDYTTLDKFAPDVAVHADLMDMPFEEASFDVIVCSHVLEHVDDDIRAVRELRRVLAPGGWAILQVPIDSERSTTLEDPSVVTAVDRRRVFGQHDHVRIYGLDYPSRLEAAGFDVTADEFAISLDAVVADRCRINSNEVLYVARVTTDE